MELCYLEYAAIPVDMELPVQDPQSTRVLDDSQLKVRLNICLDLFNTSFCKIKSTKQNHQWLYRANV